MHVSYANRNNIRFAHQLLTREGRVKVKGPRGALAAASCALDRRSLRLGTAGWKFGRLVSRSFGWFCGFSPSCSVRVLTCK